MLLWELRDHRGSLPPSQVSCEGVVPDLRGIDEVELRYLFDELLYLPELDTSLQLRLGILTPTMDSAIRSIQDDDVGVRPCGVRQGDGRGRLTQPTPRVGPGRDHPAGRGSHSR